VVQQPLRLAAALNVLRVLLEGHSDVPVLREVLTRRFRLVEDRDFRLIPHQGKGALPKNPLAAPEVGRRGLLDQLPAKLRAFAGLGAGDPVVVVVDADRTPCTELLAALQAMLNRLPQRPSSVLFRIAIEEVESWFVADVRATLAAFPRCRRERLRRVPPDAVVGAAEVLDRALGGRGGHVPGAVKVARATAIAPYLNLDDPPSPSLARLIAGLARVIDARAQQGPA
jgi:hypothetical protein